MGENKKFPSPLIKRLPIYYRYLSALMRLDISRVSSKDIGKRLGITSSQVRQDIFTFGGNGLQGYGYDVKILYDEIHRILGLDTLQTMIIIGAGNLGQALAKHSNFEKIGFKVVSIFDIKSLLIGEKIRDIEIRHIDTLPDFIKDTKVDIAAITVPEAYAPEVAKLVTDLGIDGIWNFAPVELKVPEHVIVENIHLSDSLMVLGYRLKERDTKRKR